MSDGPVILWGEVLWDRLPTGDQLGGAPANVAWHLGMAGAWAVLATRVGNDAWGQRAIDRMQLFVDTALVQRDNHHLTGEVSVTLIEAEPRYRLIADRAWEHIECDTEVRAALDQAVALVYGTLAQRTPRGYAQWQAAIAAAAPGCIKVCDPNLRGELTQFSAHETVALRQALAHADIIKINDREVGALRQIFTWPDPVAALLDRPRIVAVTHGAAGSTLHRRNAAGLRQVHQIAGARPAHRAANADNIGCGDAYVAILLHGLLEGWSLQASGTVASRWAAQVAGCAGATPVFDDEMLDMLIGERGSIA